MSENAERKWWQRATGYQIWPFSFKDSNGDGIGDINGIASKLDYLKTLGVDLIWLSPVHDSPQHDMGYDIRNYEDVWATYGSLDDMDNLIASCKERGIRLIMDLVINHTSIEHAWFQESKASRTNAKTDWYIWRDPKRGPDGELTEPNNWRAAFGGSVWTYVAERDQYYLHLALPEQPDLNWQNPDTRKAIYESAVRFWLSRGVDGFRMDVVNFYWKDPSFPDAQITIPGDAYQPMEAQHILNGPDVHIWLKELRERITETYGENIVLIGELPATGKEEILKYISDDRKELNTILDLNAFMAGNDWNAQMHDRKERHLPLFKQAVADAQWYSSTDRTWPTTFLESHDYPRSVSDLGPGEGQYHERAAKMLALFNTTLSGTLFVYQGQELGMCNVPNTWTRQQLRDKASLRYLEEMDRTHPNDETMRQRAMEGALRFGRDNARTPVQWSKEPYAGFSTVEPWIQVHDNYLTLTVADQEVDGNSILTFWKTMLLLRKERSNLLMRGTFSMLDAGNENIFAYRKSHAETEETAIVVLNFSSDRTRLHLPGDIATENMRLLMSNCSQALDGYGEDLEPWEGRLWISNSE